MITKSACTLRQIALGPAPIKQNEQQCTIILITKQNQIALNLSRWKSHTNKHLSNITGALQRGLTAVSCVSLHVFLCVYRCFSALSLFASYQ